MKIELTKDEAIVLFDFLSRNNEEDGFKTLTKDQAEERMLWDLESLLEEGLDDVFLSDYDGVLKKAREAVRDKEWFISQNFRDIIEIVFISFLLLVYD